MDSDQTTESSAPAAPETSEAARADALAVLRRVDLFDGLDQSELETLGGLFSEEVFASHRRVYRHGDASDVFYVIRTGAVSIFRDERGKPLQLLERLGPGDFFGETGLFEGYKRTASARTSTTTRVLRIGKDQLLAFLDRHPAVAVKLQIAAARRHSKNVAAALDLGERTEVRIGLRQRVTLVLEGAERRRVTLENLSLGGLCVRQAPSSWREGATVRFVVVYLTDELRVTARVSWREDDSVGLAFHAPDSEHDAQVQAFLRVLLS
ncbi:MAG: cyclic nucleotide-binding domain-containing protein [Acidobacteriota bacterium]